MFLCVLKSIKTSAKGSVDFYLVLNLFIIVIIISIIIIIIIIIITIIIITIIIIKNIYS